MIHSLRRWLLLMGAVLVIMSGCTVKDEESIQVRPDNSWVVIMDLEKYPEGYTDIITDNASAKRMKEMFLKMGVADDHIRMVLDEMQRSDVLDSLEWIKENADKNDVVFFYVSAHGRWLAREVMWEAFVSEEWLALDVSNKVLMIDSCNSGKFVNGFEDTPEAGMAFAVASSDEISWIGLEEEGLPIVGTVWAKYFTESVFDERADTNGDKLITMEEALNRATPQVHKYMREEVFVVEDFLKMYQVLPKSLKFSA